MKAYVQFVLTLIFILFNSTAGAVIYNGVDFPDGEISFADAVVSYSPGADVGGNYIDPNDALGIPDWDPVAQTGSVSLGNGGELVLQFTDNSLTTSGTADFDLWIFEIGSVTEWFNVAISTDNVNWIDLGNVLGQPTGIDIDAVAGVVQNELYSFVRLSDISPDQTGFPYGEADIDAVGAIYSAPPVSSVPEPGTLLLLSSALLGLGLSKRK